MTTSFGRLLVGILTYLCTSRVARVSYAKSHFSSISKASLTNSAAFSTSWRHCNISMLQRKKQQDSICASRSTLRLFHFFLIVQCSRKIICCQNFKICLLFDYSKTTSNKWAYKCVQHVHCSTCSTIITCTIITNKKVNEIFFNLPLYLQISAYKFE